MELKCKNEDQTYHIASKLALKLKGGDIIFLNGDLGAGKTTFVKAIASSLNIKDTVTSPTFTLLKTYESKSFCLVHVDAYRLDGESFEELEDYISDDNVIFIEWASCLQKQNYIKEGLEINISYVSAKQRIFSFVAKNERFKKILEEIENV